MAYTDCTKIKIEGLEVTGYSSYDVIHALTYVYEPTRTVAGNIVELNYDETFYVTTIKLEFNMLPYNEYKQLVAALVGTTPELSVTYYDVDSSTEETAMFYVAPATEKEIFIKNKNIYGIRNFTLELISTNNTVKSRNLLDKSIAIARTKGSINSSGLVVSNANYYNIYIKIKPNTQYHLNAGYENSSTFWFVKEGYPPISTFANTSGKSPSTANYLGVTIPIDAHNYINSLQLEYGTVATSYEEF